MVMIYKIDQLLISKDLNKCVKKLLDMQQDKIVGLALLLVNYKHKNTIYFLNRFFVRKQLLNMIYTY